MNIKKIFYFGVFICAVLAPQNAAAQGFACRVRGVELQAVFDAPTVGWAHVSMFYHLIAAGYAKQPEIFRGIKCDPLNQ